MLLHSLLVSEEKQYRSVPEVLAGVLTLEEYQARCTERSDFPFLC
jgi:hypothetical protein